MGNSDTVIIKSGKYKGKRAYVVGISPSDHGTTVVELYDDSDIPKTGIDAKYVGILTNNLMNVNFSSNKWTVTYKDEDGESTASFDSEKEAQDFTNHNEARVSSGEKFKLIDGPTKSENFSKNFSERIATAFSE